MLLLIVRDAIQSGRIDLSNHAKVVGVYNELASSEAVLTKWIPNIARHEPLGKCETLIAQVEDFAYG